MVTSENTLTAPEVFHIPRNIKTIKIILLNKTKQYLNDIKL